MTTFLILMPTPVPPAGGTNELQWQQEALAVYNSMIAKGYNQLAAEWKGFYPSFHVSHPLYSVNQVLSAFVGEILSGALGGGLAEAAQALGLIPGAAAKGAQNAANTLTTIANPLDWLKYPADFFYRLTQPSTWIRIAEFVVGGMLVYVGIKAVVGPGPATAARSGVQTAKKGGGVVRKVATSVTPTGRAARVISRHETRVKASKTRQRAEVIRGKQRNFSRKQLYP